MKKILFILTIILCTTMAHSQTTYTREGNNFTKVPAITTFQDSLTSYTYTVKETAYPIYVTKNGRCYIIRVSKKGNEYKHYLEESIAREICTELGVKYVEAKKP